jgi:alpha-L-fucosidase
MAREDVISYSLPNADIAANRPDWLKKRLQWFQDLKFGMILHWAPYSLWDCCESWPLVEDDTWARSGPEWEARKDDFKQFQKDYWNLNHDFNPTEFDPGAWADAAKAAGMKYVVFTTKHHDGFCMFDTKTTDYRITHPDCPFHSHEKANITRHVFDAFRERGLAIGCYFSKSDWRCPHYWSPDRAAKNRNCNYDPAQEPELWEKFKTFTYAQIEELMTEYGTIDILWLDGGQVRPPKQDIDMDKLVSMARRHQPGLIVVDRASGGAHEDVITPEHEIPDHPLGQTWESCTVIANHWKHHSENESKPLIDLVRMLVDIVCRDGNLLLGVGPTPQGTFTEDVLERLLEIGNWTGVNHEALYNTRAYPPYREGNIGYTSDGKFIYAIVLAEDSDEALPPALALSPSLPAPAGPVSLLGRDEDIDWKHEAGVLTLQLPDKLPHQPAWTFKIPL